MKTFDCDACGSLVFFENTTCLACQHTLGFLPDVLDLGALQPAPDRPHHFRALAAAARDRLYRTCANGRDHGVCNWLVPADDPEPLCTACRLNDVIPDLSAPANLPLWHRLELAKRRLVYTLLSLRLPTEPAPNQNIPALRFSFLNDTSGAPPVLTGHAGGVVTINLAEADDAVREQRRVNLHEPFRTLLGHFRHEVAHYYWLRLVAPSPPLLARFRALFGDDSTDYSAALNRHYEQGPPADWPTHHVSAYASAHPWEDWAETAAHYLHLIDTVETAAGFGLSLRPRHHPAAASMTTDARQLPDPAAAGFDALLSAWFPLTYALNSLNRGVGLPDLYPFALSTPALEKLRFVHEVLRAR